MTTKLSVFLLTLLATTLMAGASLAAESATMTNPMSKPEPIFRETDNYPALGYTKEFNGTKEFNEHYGVAPAWTEPIIGKELSIRETDDYPALGYTKEFNEHYGVAPAWTSSLSGKELIIRETDEHPSLGYGNF